MNNLREKALSSVKWTVGRNFFSSFIVLGFTMITVRLLTPKDFGIMAVANIVIAFGTLASRLGLTGTIIQKHEIKHNEIEASFTVSIFLSAFIYLLIALNVHAIENYFKIDGLSNILLVLSLSIILQSFVNTSTSLLERELNYSFLSKVELIIPIARGIITIILALIGLGVWSIVYGTICGQAIGTVLLANKRKNIFKLNFDIDAYKDIYKYGMKYSLVQVIDYIYGNSNTFFISKYYGTSITGIFERSGTFVRLPISNLIVGVNRVMFPIFSRLQHDREASAKYFLTNLIVLGGLVTIFSGTIAGTSEELVNLLLGKKWSEAVVPFKYLAIFSCFEYLASIMFSPLDSNSKLKIRIFYKLIPLAIRILIYSLISRTGQSFNILLLAITCIEFFYLTLYTIAIGQLFQYKSKDIIILLCVMLANILCSYFLITFIKELLVLALLPQTLIFVFIPISMVILVMGYMTLTNKMGYHNFALLSMLKSVIKKSN